MRHVAAAADERDGAHAESGEGSGLGRDLNLKVLAVRVARAGNADGDPARIYAALAVKRTLSLLSVSSGCSASNASWTFPVRRK